MPPWNRRGKSPKAGSGDSTHEAEAEDEDEDEAHSFKDSVDIPRYLLSTSMQHLDRRLATEHSGGMGCRLDCN